METTPHPPETDSTLADAPSLSEDETCHGIGKGFAPTGNLPCHALSPGEKGRGFGTVGSELSEGEIPPDIKMSKVKKNVTAERKKTSESFKNKTKKDGIDVIDLSYKSHDKSHTPKPAVETIRVRPLLLASPATPTSKIKVSESAPGESLPWEPTSPGPLEPQCPVIVLEDNGSDVSLNSLTFSSLPS